MRVRGVNHLLVPATTGEADEYPNLKDKRVSADVSTAIVSWLQTTARQMSMWILQTSEPDDSPLTFRLSAGRHQDHRPGRRAPTSSSIARSCRDCTAV